MNKDTLQDQLNRYMADAAGIKSNFDQRQIEIQQLRQQIAAKEQEAQHLIGASSYNALLIKQTEQRLKDLAAADTTASPQ